MGQHAILSASASKRWMNCTPSALLEKQFADEESIYAAEGTAAHRKSEKTDGKGRGAGLYRHSAFYGCYAAGWFGSNRMGFPCVRAEVHL